jgi:hypothetical protein
VDQLALAQRQAVADLAQRVGVSRMAEEHGHELRPARESLGALVGLMLARKPLEF